MPVDKVPISKQWQTLRDKSGGKKGLSKVSIGKSLDAFHDAVEKTARSNDIALVTKTMAALKKDLMAYVAQVSKKKEYNELSSTVKREMLSPLDKYRKAMEDMSKAGMKEIAVVEREVKMVIDESNKVSDKANKELKGLNKELSVMTRKYSDGVKPDELKKLGSFLKDAAKVAMKWTNGAKSLDKSLLQLIKDHARDHRPVIDKFNSDLGKAKKSVKEMADESKRAQNYIKLIAGYAKK